ncbi:serine protease inhibitor 77Ba [Tribolium castaneum]|uniref:Serpin peptidase inhibitor 30 n=1 Tax=Tribolium castaneum TaxID=7070 RepID=D6W777_TRICA|nr:PREDICTED: leukocyte elastase inhibitor [Tribolium castaneum]XP_008193485.1 PREDICTED: leukocyte elastase inhibitor [Tribolium castaneum]XP_008193486.1 PREDICTED: leukocyte elastase inhibitor [Tribolium castaneum]EFA11609.1 serpin peptidase inhibitor 30 [Tribolium castaneum]|eukprot:XP_008193484.1 PREDICTED: leukocyte elastase inhibitor [Tribolium castaneum]
MDLKRKLPIFIWATVIFCIKAQSISDSSNAFAIDLLAATSKEPRSPRNLALSPYTVWTLLSIIDEGAKDKTAKQMESVLRIPSFPDKAMFRNSFKNLSALLSEKDDGVNLDIYNAIFTTKAQELKTDFRDIAHKDYGVKIEPTDFSDTRTASDRINKYVASATKNRIRNFIRPDDVFDAEIFIVSAMYFKGTWMKPFNRSETRRDTFYDEKQNKLGEVDMMSQMGFFPYSRLEWIRGYAIELPYGKGDKMSMIVILPYKDQTLANMLNLMAEHPFSRIIDRLNKAKEDFEGEDVKVYLPRFTVKSDLTLNTVLEKMGMPDVFDASQANLLGMFPHYLYISRLLQRAEIQVNEEGTVATAASGASAVNKAPPPKFVANKPFLYFIVNKPAKSIVFAGKVSVPP